VPGAITAKVRRTPRVSRGTGRRSASPARAQDDISHRNCAKPSKPVHQQQRGNQEQVQQDRGRGGGREPVDGIQHAALQRDERDKQEVGKGDPGKLDGEAELGRIRAEARCYYAHDGRHKNLAEQNETEKRCQ